MWRHWNPIRKLDSGAFDRKTWRLVLAAMPIYIDTLPSLPAGFGTLVKINFIVSDQAPAGIVIPIEFQNDPYWQSYWGHYNAYTRNGMDFIHQPPCSDGF